MLFHAIPTLTASFEQFMISKWGAMQREVSRPRKLAMWDLQRTMRGASTPRKSFTPMLPVSLLQWREMNGENNQDIP